MQVCNDCNHPLDMDDHFCSHCGNSVDRAERSVAVATAPSPGSSERAGSALGSLEAILRADSSDAGRLTLASFHRLCEGEIDDALLAAESAVTMNPRLWSAHLLAGVARNQRGETEHAEAHLHDAMQAEPMVVHHKAALERMLAGLMPKRRGPSVPTGWMKSLSPATWAAVVGVPVLLLGLMLVATSGGRKNEFRRERPRFGGARPAANSTQPNVPMNNPFPTPAPVAPTYSSPAPISSYTPPSPNRPSPPPPVRTDDDPPYRSVEPQRNGPGALPSATNPTPLMDPLPPMTVDVSSLRGSGAGSGSGNTSSASEREDPTPWTKSSAQEKNQAGVGLSMNGRPTGRATVGSVPPTVRPNLPPPPDAVLSSSRVATSAPTTPQRPPAPAAAETRTETPASSNARSLQSNARRLQNQGRNTEAAQAYRDAISAYQQDYSEGRNPRAAEYGIAASKAALDLLESSH